MAKLPELDSKSFMALFSESQTECCARCGHLGTRLGKQDGKLVVDVLCTQCFEHAPHLFKVTRAQDVYRDAIKAGAHPRFAARLAEVRGRFQWGER